MNTESKITSEELEKIRGFTRKDMNEDELYTFSVILCDNEIDREGDRFTPESLEKLAQLFVGKTGIFDHNMTGRGQTARIFDTTVEKDASKTTKEGEPYTFIKAKAYMIRTESNKDLISEIEGGIKKETSVNCRMGKTVCSICGKDMKDRDCHHIRGRAYGNKICSRLLLEPEDAYEWSFVAVPAQKNAGVIKSFSPDEKESEWLSEFRNEMTESVIRECSKIIPSADPELINEICDSVSVKALKGFRDSLVKETKKQLPLVRQLTVASLKTENNDNYII